MRNEPLHAYSLHQRPFQEKRTIYYLLTQEHGVLHGIGKKGIPQFVPLTLFATGKKSLKTFQQVNIAEAVPSLIGQQQYAALYVNEITLKLLPVEDSVPTIYKQYSQTMRQLQQPLDRSDLKLVLRIYEQVLFSELGFEIDLEQDSEQNPIELTHSYRFSPESGWIPVTKRQEETEKPTETIKQTESSMLKGNGKHTNSFNSIQVKPIQGKTIIDMREGINNQTLDTWSIVYRQLIDHLFDYQPLQSRILWQQFYRYQ